MPRNPDAPRPSEMYWVSDAEKQAALALIPAGVSFSNYAREHLFNLPPREHGGSRKEEALNIKQQIAQLKSMIATDRMVIREAEKTYQKSGRESAATRAETQRAAMERRQAKLEKLEAQLAEESRSA